MWNYDDDHKRDKDHLDWDEEFRADVDADREFKSVEEYLDEYEDGV